MNIDEAQAWLQGQRSNLNWMQQNHPDMGHDEWARTQAAILAADSSSMEQAYWTLRAHKEGLVSVDEGAAQYEPELEPVSVEPADRAEPAEPTVREQAAEIIEDAIRDAMVHRSNSDVLADLIAGKLRGLLVSEPEPVSVEPADEDDICQDSYIGRPPHCGDENCGKRHPEQPVVAPSPDTDELVDEIEAMLEDGVGAIRDPQHAAPLPMWDEDLAQRIVAHIVARVKQDCGHRATGQVASCDIDPGRHDFNGHWRSSGPAIQVFDAPCVNPRRLFVGPVEEDDK